MSVYIIKLPSDFITAADFAMVFAAEETVKVCGFTPERKNFLPIKRDLKSVKPKETTVIPWSFARESATEPKDLSPAEFFRFSLLFMKLKVS